MHDKVVPLGNRLRYPITVTKLFKKPGDKIKKQENIFEYKFSWRRQLNEHEFNDENTYTEFDSPAEGLLRDWRIEEGMVIEADMPCMTIEEVCGHEVQIQGLCSLCGADMTETDWANPEGRETDRAMINMAHDNTGLMVSANVARKTEHDTQKRLLRQRKLSLVVDLDQTIIHACIDPTVGEWQRDESSPNHNSVKHVNSFQLSDDGPRGVANGCTYYIKLRPGLRQFLAEISEMYELHVYTMGTRAYAQKIAEIVDPEKKLFGNRVISRDENGSITAKSLQRLFPVSTNMVVIIDDRADVWPMNRDNLIKVVPYDFFKGIGDINGSFLPKRREILPARPKINGTVVVPILAAPSKDKVSAKEPAEELTNEPVEDAEPVVGEDDVSDEDEDAAEDTTAVVDPVTLPVEDAAAIVVDEEEALKQQAEEQEKTLEKQLTERPLQHMQEELEKEEEEAKKHPELPIHHRHNLLTDDDEELVYVQDHLTDLHEAFYKTYDKRLEERQEKDPKPRRKSADNVDLALVPDVGDLLDELKMSVLSGTVICLSGLIPLGMKIEQFDLVQQAQAHGAQVIDSVSPRCTHLVVAMERPNTRKVDQARKLGRIHIVNQNWLVDSLSQWRHLDEAAFYMDLPPGSDDGDGEATGFVGGIDWGAADKEIEEFLGEDFDMEDSESEVSEEEERGVKRGRSEEEGEGGSALAKKQRVAKGRGESSLRAVSGNDEGELDELEAELERELLRELEATEG